VYRRLIKYVKPYMGRFLLGCAFGVVYALSNAAMVWAIRDGIRKVFGDGMGTIGVAALIVSVLFFPVVALVRGAADFFANYFVQWVGNRVVLDLRNGMFVHLHDLPVAFFSHSRTGDLIARITNDTAQVERATSTVIADIAKEPVTLVGMMVWLFVIDARLALVSLIVFPVCVVPIVAFGRRVRRYSKQAQERIADLVSILQETFSGVRIVKAFGMEAYETRRFMEQTSAFFGRVMRLTRGTSAMEPIMVFISSVGTALVLVYVYTVRMPVDQFIAFAAALLLMYEPVKKISKMYVNIQQTSACAERIFEILDEKCDVKEDPGAATLSGPINKVEFVGVDFRYAEAPVLTGINLEVHAGERVAIVGGSGAGKTTMVSLLLRFFDVSGGRVVINGIDVRNLTLKSLRRQIGLVSQETFLFNDTVMANIAYGMQDASYSAVEQAAKRAYAHDFIMEMPQAYDTVVGERGVRLSGGQRQRLAIARAILRNPPILILDEATNALDTESERMVQAALDEMMEGRTVFAIAHRLSTVTRCDKIIVLDSGRIVESGRHADLLAKGGIYKRLYDMQFSDAPAAPGGPMQA
jgi:subfamily B ATP-binding cassette protein MsbA